MLNVLESDEIKIELSSPTRAGILHPSEKADGEDHPNACDACNVEQLAIYNKRFKRGALST